ncbi:hypothetical protein L3C95_13490 [Chitinophaga filiformis]|uniref:hypothetical protein n=1 Tax=Chitinophaga filiformis TaxID=104663 RepID=UPI001F264844|nr:hypothetical protein [Chitinophaga filiformis]MCF6403900.1 hypothetical protein [Chitinophaga filiformis]
MKRRTPKIVHVFKFIVLGALFFCFIGFAVQFLWNWLIPELFHGPLITFWQAIGLCLLGKLIFGWHGNGGGAWGMRAKQQWRRKMMEKMENMSEEERDKLREKLRRCGMPNRWGNEGFYNEPKDQQKTETNL